MPLLLLPYSLLGWPTSSTAGMMPPYGAQGEVRRIPLPRTPVNTARTCGTHRGGDVSHDIEEAKILAPNGVDGTMPFRKQKRGGWVLGEDLNTNADTNGLIRVLLADDHTMFREGLAGILASYGGMEVIAEVPNDGD